MCVTNFIAKLTSSMLLYPLSVRTCVPFTKHGKPAKITSTSFAYTWNSASDILVMSPFTFSPSALQFLKFKSCVSRNVFSFSEYAIKSNPALTMPSESPPIPENKLIAFIRMCMMEGFYLYCCFTFCIKIITLYKKKLYTPFGFGYSYNNNHFTKLL